MKERPILFSGPMVRAILNGTKTQTRRVVKPQPSDTFMPEVGLYHPTLVDKRDGEQFPGPETFGASDESEDYPCPYGQPGDRLWVRETWRVDWADEAVAEIGFRADGGSNRCAPPIQWLNTVGQDSTEPDGVLRWKPSIFMPRWASRNTLEILAVRAERLNDISEADAREEGVTLRGMTRFENEARLEYKQLWESINNPGSWDKNPWVWVIEFKPIKN